MSKGENAWPLSESTATYTAESKVEEKKTAIVILSEAREVESIANLISIENFSSLLSLLSVTAWVRRFIFNCRAKSNASDKTHGRLTRAELQTPQNDWVKRPKTV